MDYEYNKDEIKIEDAIASSVFIIPIEDNKPIKFCFEGPKITSNNATKKFIKLLDNVQPSVTEKSYT